MRETLRRIEEGMFMAPRSDDDRREIADYVASTANYVLLALADLETRLGKAETEARMLKQSLGEHSTAKLVDLVLGRIKTAAGWMKDARGALHQAEKTTDAVVDGLGAPK